MKTINKLTQITYEVNKSKFICYLMSYSEYTKNMQELKSEHPKARHYVYAYRYINEFDQIVENQSDDGEPKGSSGPPALAVLRGNDLVNTAAIIVRYFGGIKLGVGGLVRAYGKSVNLALDQVLRSNNISNYTKQMTKTFSIKLSLLSTVEFFLKSLTPMSIEREFFGEKCTLFITSTEENLDQVESYLAQNNIAQ